MNTYELKLGEFTGPLDKLLEFIEGKKLEITKISLAEVTADFISYLKSIQDVHPRVLSDFVSVASKLILIKSHTLLPQLSLTSDEEAEIGDFEDRLRLYKEFKDAQKNIKSAWDKKVSYSRDFLMDVQTGFFMSQAIKPEDLRDMVERICGELAQAIPKIEAGSIKLINFEEKVKELLERVTNAVTSSFSEISKGRDRTEIVVLFLAILHLLKDSLIKIEQGGDFADIKIEKKQLNGNA